MIVAAAVTAAAAAAAVGVAAGALGDCCCCCAVTGKLAGVGAVRRLGRCSNLARKGLPLWPSKASLRGRVPRLGLPHPLIIGVWVPLLVFPHSM